MCTVGSIYGWVDFLLEIFNCDWNICMWNESHHIYCSISIYSRNKYIFNVFASPPHQKKQQTVFVNVCMFIFRNQNDMRGDSVFYQ